MQFLIIIQVLLNIWIPSALTTTAGLTYMDRLNFGPYKPAVAVEDPCNPLYWYPRNIPEYCYHKSTAKTPSQPPPSVPLPIPAPLPPQPLPFSNAMPAPMPYLPIPPAYPLLPPLQPMPMGAPPLPYGIPLQPSHQILPVGGMPYPHPLLPYNSLHQMGFVPGISGMVSHDGGINILPFSDAYSDLLEKHKQKMIRRKYQKIIKKYEGRPWTS